MHRAVFKSPLVCIEQACLPNPALFTSPLLLQIYAPPFEAAVAAYDELTDAVRSNTKRAC